MLSVNGSPLANPLALDLSTWLSQKGEVDNDEPEAMRNRGAGQSHYRTTSIIVRSTSASSHTSTSRANSNPAAIRSNGKVASMAPNRKVAKPDTEEKSVAALVSVPTADGHLLEFDPFRTTPGEIDALEGITNSAKKKAKEDMRSLVVQAVERWRID